MGAASDRCLGGSSPAVVTFMTTGHCFLQTARSAGITELTGRAGFYLATVSSG